MGPGGPFLERPGNFSGAESCFFVWRVCIQDQSFNNFENDTIKLSDIGAKLNGLWARNCAIIQHVFIFKFALGPKSHWVFREMSPRGPSRLAAKLYTNKILSQAVSNTDNQFKVLNIKKEASIEKRENLKVINM